MEELDKIIIDSLNSLNCDLDEDITTLRHFDANTTLRALSTCLEAINPSLKLPKKLPISLSARMRTALSVAQQIKDLGFKGDMGYQSILYCNEVEVRRVLIFLIERLPKEGGIGVVPLEQTGYVPRIVRKIEDALTEELQQGWLPSEIFKRGIRQTSFGQIIVESFGASTPLDCCDLLIPNSNENTEVLDEFTYIPDVTKQCKRSQLIPSLLFGGAENKLDSQKLAKLCEKDAENLPNIRKLDIQENADNRMENLEVVNKTSNELQNETKLEKLYEEIKKQKEDYFASQELVNKLEETLKKMQTMKSKEEKSLEELVSQVKLKKKTNAALSNDENIAKLQSLIENATDRLSELHKQWNEVQTPLLAEKKSLKSSLSSEMSKYDSIQNKLSRMKQTYTTLVAGYEEKLALEKLLTEKCREMSKKNNRAAYTRRILEIVGNIKKQNGEIQKVLADTRQIQKEINNLTGQVERSFILSEELIFQDASQDRRDETAKSSYKLLVMLRDEYEKILTAITDFGQAERETRNLEEQVELEKSKDMRIKLDKITNDLAEMKKEIQLMQVNGN